MLRPTASGDGALSARNVRNVPRGPAPGHVAPAALSVRFSLATNGVESTASKPINGARSSALFPRVCSGQQGRVRFSRDTL